MKTTKFINTVAALAIAATAFTACSSDDDDNSNATPSEEAYKDRTYGNAAIDACDQTVTALNTANEAIAKAKLTEEQETALRQVLTNLVNNVIVPTYTDLADDVEDLEKTFNGLTVSTITQAQIDKACADFKAARQHWERSEAFLGGAASDFSIDPTIDSWPLDRAELLDYFKGGMKADTLSFAGEAHKVDCIFIIKDTVSVTQLVPGLTYENGGIVVDRHMATAVPGVFAAGDCTGKPLQLAKAVGEGNVAALSACDWLDRK